MGRICRPRRPLGDIIKKKDNGCWDWTASKTKGYGQLVRNRRHQLAHRAIYELFNPKIPAGNVLHHKCENKSCVNPDHLQPLTQRQNILRGNGASAKNKTKTHCPKGHEYKGDNIYLRPDRPTHRQCKKCLSEKARIYYLKRRDRSVSLT